MYAFDRQTDGQTVRQTDRILIATLDHVCIPCSTVKTM